MKLMVLLLALCLTLSVVSVQAQNNLLGNMEDIDMIMTGNVTETVRCSITGNAAIVEEMNFTDNTGNVTGNMTNTTGNMTNVINNTNVAQNTTLKLTGKMVLIRDMDNMTEKAVIVGTADNIPGKVVIFGRTDNTTANMTGNQTGNMTNTTGNMTNVPKNMVILTSGNITGTIMFRAAGDTSGNMISGTSNAKVSENMTLLMTGNMTGNITGDMTKKMVVIKNMGDLSEMSQTISNLTEMNGGMANTTGSTKLDLLGKMIIIKNMDNTTVMNDENVEDLIAMDGNAAILECMDNLSGTNKNMNQNMNSSTGKIVTVTSLDSLIRITTNNITCNTTQSTFMVRNMGSAT